YVDLRTRQDRTENQTEHWHLQLDLLVNAYLDYRSRDSGDGMPTLDDELLEPPLDDSPERSYSSLRSRPLHKYPNETLIYHGYIGCAPIYPTAAVSLRTLATYRQIHRSCPRFSIQAQVKSLCFLHDVLAYDIYLEILHRVDQRLRMALKHDTPHWRMLNSCPACFYKLEDEPALEFEWLVSIDGNNSLKRWDSTIYGSKRRLDSRKARSDYWLDACDVDRFKDEVR
ncbi:hypothetical protein C8R48DRAFT_583257, partial [Suillus tomentosus]